jgi:hypothetical protein
MALPRKGDVQPVEGVIGGVPIPVSGAGGVPNRSDFYTGQKNVAVAGTAEQCPAQAVPDGFTIFLRAKVGNAGTVWVSNSKANAEDHTVATPLEAGAFLTLALTNTDIIWIDADVSGEGACLTVEV